MRIKSQGPLLLKQPYGSMYANRMYFGPNIPIQGLLQGQCIYHSGTWTLKVVETCKCLLILLVGTLTITITRTTIKFRV